MEFSEKHFAAGGFSLEGIDERVVAMRDATVFNEVVLVKCSLLQCGCHMSTSVRDSKIC